MGVWGKRGLGMRGSEARGMSRTLGGSVSWVIGGGGQLNLLTMV